MNLFINRNYLVENTGCRAMISAENFEDLEHPFIRTYSLDNAAIIFSLVSSARISALFRLSVTLKEPINVNILQQALENIIVRFPYFRVELRKGLFWYYWRTNLGIPKVIADSKSPCEEMPIRKKGIFPIRVRAFQNRIAVEYHHSLTDGTGGYTFLKALLGEYLKIKGIEVEDWGDIFRPHVNLDPEEYEDAYKRYYKKDVPRIKRISKAYHLPYKLEKKGVYHVTTGIVPVDKLLKITREINVSLTEFLVAIYIEAIQEILCSSPLRVRRRTKNPIRISVPINLRRIYPSKTLRNFTLMLTPGIDPRLGKHTFDEILNHVYHYMRTEISDKLVSQTVKRNVQASLNPIVRLIPLVIKQLAGRAIYMQLGEKLYSGSFSNLGRVQVPKEFEEHIESFQFIPGYNPVRKVGCSVVSFKNNLYINFGRVCEEAEVERYFFKKLVKLGLPVKIETN